VGFYVSISVPMVLRGRAVVVEVIDHYIQDGEIDDDGFAAPDELIFAYKVYDTEAEAEIVGLTQEEHGQIQKAIIEDFQNICE
jgi:hypothetical protein